MTTRLPLPAAQLSALSTPFRVLAFLLTGSPTLAQMEQETRDQVSLQGRKFNKVEAVYAPLAPVPPLGWEYTCRQCRFFEADTLTCSQVGLADDPWGGESIGTLAWCAWWLPLENQPLLSWIPETLEGRR